MFVDKESLKVNGISLGKYLTQVDYNYNKLWSEDSGRNLAGTQSGTLIGIFPKFELQFRKLTKDELHKLAPIFDSASQTVEYYDDNKGKMTSIDTYTGDWKVTNKSINSNEAFSISFIAKKRRV